MADTNKNISKLSSLEPKAWHEQSYGRTCEPHKNAPSCVFLHCMFWWHHLKMELFPKHVWVSLFHLPRPLCEWWRRFIRLDVTRREKFRLLGKSCAGMVETMTRRISSFCLAQKCHLQVSLARSYSRIAKRWFYLPKLGTVSNLTKLNKWLGAVFRENSDFMYPVSEGTVSSLVIL